jgi:iron(III) transport system substrate-binding protein
MRTSRLLATALAVATLCTACTATSDGDGVLTIYAGRGEDLIAQVIADFEADTGIDVEVRYAGTAELAAQLLEEGDATPADLFWAQDAGALGAVDQAGLLTTLPDDVLNLVDPANRADNGSWVGVTGRARVIVWSTERLTEADVPTSVLDLTDAQWRGRVGWAPTNGSFQAFVTAMRVTLGEAVTKSWLEGMLANDVQEYSNNSSQVEAVGRGEIDMGLVNHYYLLRFLAEDPSFPAANAFPSGDIGSLLNVSGIAQLKGSGDDELAVQFVTFLLSQDVQTYFAGVTDEAEYPLVAGVEPSSVLPALSELNPPAVDLSDLADLEGTLELLREVGALQ